MSAVAIPGLLDTTQTDTDWELDLVLCQGDEAHIEDWTGSEVLVELWRQQGGQSTTLNLSSASGDGLLAPTAYVPVAFRVPAASMNTLLAGNVSGRVRRVFPNGATDLAATFTLHMVQGQTTPAGDPGGVSGDHASGSTVKLIKQVGAVRLVRAGGARGLSAKQIALDAGAQDLPPNATDEEYTTWLRKPAQDAADQVNDDVSGGLLAINETADQRIIDINDAGNAQVQAVEEAGAEAAGDVADLRIAALAAIGEDNASGARGAAITAIDAAAVSGASGVNGARDAALAAVGEDNVSGARGAAITAVGDAAVSGAGTVNSARDAALSAIGQDDISGARGAAITALDNHTAAEITLVNNAGDAKLAAIALAAFAGGHVYTATATAEADGTLAVGQYYMLLSSATLKLYQKVTGPTSTFTGFMLGTDTDPVLNLRTSMARYDNQVTQGLRNYPANQVLAKSWTLTNVVRNSDGTFTGQAGGTMTISLTTSDFTTPGNRYCYVTRLDLVSAGMTVAVTSTQGPTTFATAASTQEIAPGCHRQFWTNSSSRNNVVITINFVIAGTISVPEVVLADSIYLPAIQRFDGVTPVTSAPVRTDMFEHWKRTGGDPAGRRALDAQIQAAASTAGDGTAAPVTFTGSIASTGIVTAGTPSAPLKPGMTLSGAGITTLVTTNRQISGTVGSSGTYGSTPTGLTVASTTITATPGNIYAPWTTLAALPAAVNGSIYGLRRTSFFREDFTQLRVTSYGTFGNTIVGFQLGSALAAFPIISCFELVATSDWTANGDGTYTCVKDVTNPTALQHDSYHEICVVEVNLAMEALGYYYGARRLMWNVKGGTFTASIASDGTITVANSPTPTVVIESGQPFSGSGVDPSTIISAFQVDTGGNSTGTGAGGKYLTTPTGQTVASTVMTVTDQQAVKANPGNKAVGLSGTTATITIRPTGDGVIGTDPNVASYRYEFIRRWCPVDAGDYSRDMYLFGVELQGGNYGYGVLAGPQRTVADRIIMSGDRTHITVCGGGSISNFLADSTNSYSNSVVFYSSTSPNGRNWQLKRGLILGEGGPIYCHRGASGDWALGEIEDVQLRSPRSTRPWNYDALYGDAMGGSNILKSRVRRVYAQGYQTTGVNSATSGDTDSDMRESVFRRIGRFRGRKLTQDVIACTEPISNPRIAGERNNRMLEASNGQVYQFGTSIATSRSTSINDNKPTVIATLGTITTKPIIRNWLFLIFPELGNWDSILTALPAGGVPLFELHNCVFVFGPGSGMACSIASGTTTNDWASFLSRIGDDGTNEMVDMRNNNYGLNGLLRDFTNGDLRYTNSDDARAVQQACKRRSAGCRFTLDRWPDEPTVDEYAGYLRAA